LKKQVRLTLTDNKQQFSIILPRTSSGNNYALISWNLGFDLPAGSRYAIPELEIESEPIIQKNFVTKWIDSFANTLSVWVQNAGWCQKIAV
jgi:hypothetical protein